MDTKKHLSSGLPRLDQLFDGLLIGDNVVWHDDSGSLAWVFCYNFVKASQKKEKPILYVSFDRSPKTILQKLGSLADYPKLQILDCFTSGKGSSSPVFMKFYGPKGPSLAPGRVVHVENPKDIDKVSDLLYGFINEQEGDVRLVFETLTGMQELWGGEEDLIQFYAHACPRLYELETIAYWVMEKKAHSPRMKARITQIAQVVIELSIKRGTTSLQFHKAENRGTENLKKPYTYWTRDLEVTFDEERKTPGGLELGNRIKELRFQKGLSQTELAKQVGVTPSTISQVESELIYPSLPALIKMADVLEVRPGSFFEVLKEPDRKMVFGAADALVVRPPALPKDVLRMWRLTPIDFGGKIEPYIVEFAPEKHLSQHFFTHKGEEFGFLITGRLDMIAGSRETNLSAGDVVYLTSETPTKWKNPGSAPARMLWLKVF